MNTKLNEKINSNLLQSCFVSADPNFPIRNKMEDCKLI